jgi:formaldehyde-activating enzyme involved in methanogenesis
MRLSTGLTLLMFLLLAGCSSNAKRAFYEGIKNQNEAYKTPAERAMNSSPSYDEYSKEKQKLP